MFFVRQFTFLNKIILFCIEVNLNYIIFYSSLQYKRRKMRTELLFFLLLIFVSSCFSQQPPVKSYYTDEIPNVGRIHGVMQDSRGFIWYWGDKGACQYDGHKFQSFNEYHGLQSNYCYNIVERPNGNIYIGTTKGYCIYYPHSGKIEPQKPYSNSPVRDIGFHDGNLLIAGDGGVYYIRNNGLYRLSISEENKLENLTTMVNAIYYDTEENLLWAATDRLGVISIDIEKQLPLFELKDEKLQKTYEILGYDLYENSIFDQKYPHVRVKETKSLLPITKLVMPYRDASTRHDNPQHQFDMNMTKGDSTIYKIESLRERHKIIMSSIKQFERENEPGFWEVQNIYKDLNGDILAQSGNKVFRFNGSEFEEYTDIYTQYIKEVYNSYSDKDGNTYFIGDEGCLILNDNCEKFYRNNLELYKTYIVFGLRDRHKNIWLFGKDQACISQITTENIFIFNVKEKYDLGIVLKALKVRDNELYLVGASGLGHWKDADISEIKVAKYPQNIIDAELDKNNDIVAVTSNRIYLIKPEERSVVPLSGKFSKHEEAVVITKDVSEKVWISLSGKVFHWDGKSLENIKGLNINPGSDFTEYFQPNMIFSAPDTSVYIGTWRGIIKVKNNDVWKYKFTHIQYPDNTIQLLPKKNLLYRISALCGGIGPDSAYWFGTFDTGIVRIEGDSIRSFDHRHNVPTMPYYKVSSDPDGNLYFLSDYRVMKVGKNEIQPFSLNTENNEIIYDFLKLDAERSFLVTSKGVWIEMGNTRFRLDPEIGLPHCRIKQIIPVNADNFILVQDKNLVLIKGDDLLLNQPQNIKPVITGLWAGNFRLSVENSLIMPKGKRSVRISFTLPDYFNESVHQFAWQLEGFEDDFIEYNKYHEVNYANLDPGKYTFFLKAKNGYGIETELTQPINITIPPLFHETLYFPALLALLFLTLMYTFFKMRIKQINVQRIKLESLVKRRTEQLEVAIDEKEDLIVDLKEAFDKIKVLDGLVPICANCKKIRDDKGFWNHLENYISEHSSATFTHGICPDCIQKLYPEITDEKKSEN